MNKYFIAIITILSCHTHVDEMTTQLFRRHQAKLYRMCLLVSVCVNYKGHSFCDLQWFVCSVSVSFSIFFFLIILIPLRAQNAIHKLMKEQRRRQQPRQKRRTNGQKKSMIGNYGQRIASLRQMVNQITVTFMSNEKAFFFVCPALSVSVIYYRSGIYFPMDCINTPNKQIYTHIHTFTHSHIFTAYHLYI